MDWMQFLRQIFQNYQPQNQYQNSGITTAQPRPISQTPEQQYQNYGLTTALPRRQEPQIPQTIAPPANQDGYKPQARPTEFGGGNPAPNLQQQGGYQPRSQPMEFGGGNPAPNLRQQIQTQPTIAPQRQPMQQQTQPMRPAASTYQQPGGGFRYNTGRTRRGGCF